MARKGLAVQLRSGITRASLPDGRRMVQGSTYAVSYEDFAKISPKARQTVIQVTSVITAATARSGVTLTTVANTAVGVLAGAKVGRVEEGMDLEDSFMLVKFLDKSHSAGAAVAWADKEARTVTGDRVGGSAASPLEFAGIVIGSPTINQFGWIQITGNNASVTSVASVAAGEVVVLDPTTDDSVADAPRPEVATLTINATGGTFTVTFGGQTTSAVAYNATAATLQTAFRALSTVGAGNATITGGPGASAAYTITFTGTLTNTNVGAITTSAASLTGGAGTAVIAVTVQGAPVSTLYVGTALTSGSGGTAEIQINGEDEKFYHKRSRVRRGQGFPAS